MHVHTFFKAKLYAFAAAILLLASQAVATTFTTSVPGTSIVLPDDYPEAGGIAIVLVGANGNLYFQFSDPTGAFVGFQNSGEPAQFRGNPFTINDPIGLDCGYSTCTDYFGGSLAEIHVRFSAYDGDTQRRGFDEDDIFLILNGFNIGNWSDVTTEVTNNSGTRGFRFETGFGNNTFNTGWFSSTNSGLLSNILTTGQTITQVFDRDPNDNYWDFTRGPRLGNNDVETVAPGMTFEKSADATEFTAAGETVTFTYIVENIGSVPLRDLVVTDDKIPNVTCDVTTIPDSPSGASAPQRATCTGTYLTTQEDVDRGFVTNNAEATATPDEGTLAPLSDDYTLDGPDADPVLFIDKTTTLTEFGDVGTTVPYSFLIRNDGNLTLTDISVSDPNLPGLVCNVPDLLPTDDFTCSGTYTVTQADSDALAADPSWTLDNTVSATATDPSGGSVPASDTVELPGAPKNLDVTLSKTATTANFSAVGDVIQYEFLVTNIGDVTFPQPTITDALTNGATCPSGSVSPGASVTCTATYTVDQDDLDRGQVDNSATVDVAVGALSASDTSTATVPALRTATMTLDKRLAPASPTSYAATNVGLTYEYVLTNTGNVTLLNPAVTDDRVAVTCTATEIAPGASVTCTSAVYSTTQPNLDDGSVTNTASATATGAGAPAEAVTSNQDSVTVNADQQPAIDLVKTAPVVAAEDFTVGNTVTYSFEITNTGNVTLTQAITGDTEFTITDDKIGTFSCGPVPLAIGASLTCTEDYQLTFLDVLAGRVVNTATAEVGTIQSPEDNAQISPELSPAISLVKTADTASVTALGDSISYSFEVTNTGDTQIFASNHPISIADPLLSSFDCSAQPATLNPGESFSCTGVRNGVTQDELDAGQVDNTAQASFVFNSNDVPVTIQSNSSSASVPVVAAPAMTFAKTGPATYSAVTETLSYTFEVTNDGNVTLDEVTVSDPLIPGLSCVLTDIAPGATDSCTDTYAVTQPDVDDESIVNTATAVAVPAQGSQLTQDATSTATIDPAAATKSLALDKTADTPSFAAVGDVITYTLAVENTGTQTLTQITVTDALDADFSCLIPTLAPLATDNSCTFTHTVTQGDIDAGQVVNTASASSPDVSAVTDSETVTGPTRNASFSFDKQAPPTFAAVGDTVDFTFEVTNDGNVTLTDVVVDDPFFGTPYSCTIPSLAPGATDSSCTATYTIEQGDVDAGEITNTASVTADAPAGVTPPASQTDMETVTGPAEQAALSVVKSSTDGTFTAVSDTEDYTFVVTNDGNVTLTNLVLDDADLGFSCALPDLAPGANTTTCADGTPLSATKTFDQEDVDAGSYTNAVTVTGESDGLGTPVDAADQDTVTGPLQLPTISLAKSSTFTGTMETVGQVLTYDFVVTNTGNITLTAQITIDDPLITDVDCPILPAAGVAPGATYTCTGEYEVTQDDLDRGFVTNTAEASVTQAVVPRNPGDPTSTTATSNESSATVTADQQPELRIEKRVKSGSAASYETTTDTVTFEYVVTNIGNVTTTDPINVTDDKIPGVLECSAAPLAPNGQVICEQDWTADQDALDAGSVTNIATASTQYGADLIESDPDSVTINAVQDPSLAIVKTFTGTNNPDVFNAGDELSYTIVVTNNGNVSIDAPITLTDNLVTPSCPAVPNDELAPGETLNCTATHIVTTNDINLGSSTNVVYATGSFNGDPVQSPSDDAIYPVNAKPALTLVKEALPANLPYTQVGQVVTYRYSVSNTGNVALSGAITIEDDVMGTLPCRAAAGGTLLPLGTSETHICEHPYTITQDDLDAGDVVNNATANTIYAPAGDATNVRSPGATETITSTQTELLTVDKQMTTALTDDVARAGDVLTYEISATNDGNQTLSGVAISDTLIPGLTCTVGGAAAPANVVLEPGEALLCTGTYTVTQDDIDAQTLTNTANAVSTDPQGDTVSGTDMHDQPLVAPNSEILVEKTLLPDPGSNPAYTTLGEPLTFVVTVTNTGNVTQASTVVTDDRVVTPTSCTIGELAPGESDDSCEFTYVITQDDLDAVSPDGSDVYAAFINTASATATPLNTDLDPATDEGEVFVLGPDKLPELSMVKSSGTSLIAAVGEIVTYDYLIANVGNVTLFEEPELTDDKIGTFTCTGMPAGGLAPQEFYTCSEPYEVTQADMDAGEVTNIATADSSEVDPVTQTLTNPTDRQPSLTLTKAASVTTGVTAGQVIDYTYTVVNTGNVTLSEATVTDQHTSATGTTALPVAGRCIGYRC